MTKVQDSSTPNSTSSLSINGSIPQQAGHAGSVKYATRTGIGPGKIVHP